MATAIDKDLIQSTIANQLNKPEVRSAHLKEQRWLLWTRRPLAEMLEVWRSPGDRDNDPTFIPFLLDRAIKRYKEGSPILACIFERNTDELRCASYSLKMPARFVSDLEKIRVEIGCTKQSLMVNLVYTGLLLEYPDFDYGSQWKFHVLEYPLALQPYLNYLQFNGRLATVIENNRVESPFIKVLIADTTEPITVRKDWLFPLVNQSVNDKNTLRVA